MDSDELAFVTEQITELRARAEHYRKSAESTRKHADEMDRLHANHVHNLETKIYGLEKRLEYQTKRADANWKALCECNGDAA